MLHSSFLDHFGDLQIETFKMFKQSTVEDKIERFVNILNGYLHENSKIVILFRHVDFGNVNVIRCTI